MWCVFLVYVCVFVCVRESLRGLYQHITPHLSFFSSLLCFSLSWGGGVYINTTGARKNQTKPKKQVETKIVPLKRWKILNSVGEKTKKFKLTL